MTNYSHLTKLGIPGISTVPYGIHMCQFYGNRDDLFDALLPYFLAGLENNERCIWIASPPLPTSEIEREIGQNPLFRSALESGQLKILDSNDWYGPLTSFVAEEVIEKWLAAEENAVADGFNGLRITGNTSFVPPRYRDVFFEYEEKLHVQFANRRIVTCCSYDRDNCKAVDVLEVVSCHHGAVERSNGEWEVLRPAPEQKLQPRRATVTGS